MTVEAACSKRRREDKLPLHPELLIVLPGWFAGMKPTEELFPRLDRKKTWLMVKRDLERVGIPYLTRDGVADFHSIGRVSFITNLLQNGAPLATASNLARHSDVRMTMAYSKNTLTEQAKALTLLPSTRPNSPNETAEDATDRESASQHFSQQSGGPSRQTAASRGTTRHKSKKARSAKSRNERHL